MMEQIKASGTVRLVPTWEAAARIFTQNLLSGSDESVKHTSMNELIKMGTMIDQYNNTGRIVDNVDSKNST